METLNLLISAILQVILFSIIPFVWWLIFSRKENGFLKWIGLKKPVIKNNQRYLISVLTVLIILLLPSLLVITFFVDESATATNQFSGRGISALIPALIYSFLQTGFSEELFFRGFLTKRLIHKIGYQWGNIIQGLLFGLLHGILFLSIVGLLDTILIVLITGVAGYLLGWINEKQSNGSILSSWIIHGFVNTVASIIAMFNIL